MLGSFYPGFMYGGASGWLGLVEMLDVNGVTTSTSLTSPTITKIAQLSPDIMSVLTNVYGLDISGGGELIVDNHSIVVGSSNPTLVVIRNLLNNNITLVTSQDGATLNRSAQMGIDDLLTSVRLEDIGINRTGNILTQNQSVSVAISGSTLAAIRNLITNELAVVVAENNLSIGRLFNMLPDSMSLVASISGVQLTSDILIGLESILVPLRADDAYMTALRSMGVEPINSMTYLASPGVQIGYPIVDIGSDNIYALGTIPQGDYDVATINNNQIYEVIEQDGI